MKMGRMKGIAVGIACGVLGMPVFAAATSPTLSFSTSAQVWGELSTSYSSSLLGDVSFTVQGTTDYKWYYYGSYSNGTPGDIASAAYTVEEGHGGNGDYLYDLVTSNGQYGFSYDGQSKVTGTHLHTMMSTVTTDATDGPGAHSSTTSMSAYSYASWSQQFYIGATSDRTAGSYGAILVGITLDGSVQGDASGWLQARSSFSDTAGVSYDSYFSVGSDYTDPAWTAPGGGTKTVFKKLLFQYGTPFTIGLTQYAWSYGNGTADFFNTGKISAIEIPFGAVLESGAEQAGLGSADQLYGNVIQSASADAENTNWDFGNNGGGFTPPVPEPETYAMMLAGLGLMVAVARRRMKG